MSEIAVQGELFSVEDTTDKRLLTIMLNNTCRTCENRMVIEQGLNGGSRVSVCSKTKSRLTKSGYKRVRCYDHACIMYKRKE